MTGGCGVVRRKTKGCFPPQRTKSVRRGPRFRRFAPRNDKRRERAGRGGWEERRGGVSRQRLVSCVGAGCVSVQKHFAGRGETKVLRLKHEFDFHAARERSSRLSLRMTEVERAVRQERRRGRRRNSRRATPTHKERASGTPVRAPALHNPYVYFMRSRRMATSDSMPVGRASL